MVWLVRAPLVLAPLLVWLISNTALAGGLTYIGAGAKALGRGGAYHVKADGPIALQYNPARMADLAGSQFQTDFNLARWDACMDPSRVAAVESDPTVGTYLENYAPGGESPATADVSRFGAIPVSTPQAERRSWAGTTKKEVCGDVSFLPIPNIAFTYNLADRLGPRMWMRGLTFSVGMVTPGVVPATTWGNQDGSTSATRHATQAEVDQAVTSGTRLPPGVRPDVICDPQTQDCSAFCDPLDPTDQDCRTQYYCDPNVFDCNALPTPTRVGLVKQDPIGIPLSVGIGWRPFPWIAIGGTFNYQLIHVNIIAYGPETPNESPEKEFRLETSLTDYFVPSVNGSILLSPYDGIDFAGFFKWAGAIEGNAKIIATANDHALVAPTDASGNYAPDQDNPAAITARGQGARAITTVIPSDAGVKTVVPQPWEIGGGVRYALLHTGSVDPSRPDHRDPMRTEVFDIEVDFVYERNSVVDAVRLQSAPGNSFDTFPGWNAADTNFTGTPAGTPPTALTFPPEQTVPRNWQDQYSIRVGGDYNVVRKVLALRLGFNYETAGVDPGYANIDVMPGERIGLGGGFTWRVGSMDISAAYGHIMQKTMDALPNRVTPPTTDPQYAQLTAPSPNPNTYIANAGSYKAAFNIFSLGVTTKF